MFACNDSLRKKKQDMNSFFTPCTHFLQITIVMSSQKCMVINKVMCKHGKMSYLYFYLDQWRYFISCVIEISILLSVLSALRHQRYRITRYVYQKLSSVKCQASKWNFKSQTVSIVLYKIYRRKQKQSLSLILHFCKHGI